MGYERNGRSSVTSNWLSELSSISNSCSCMGAVRLEEAPNKRDWSPDYRVWKAPKEENTAMILFPFV